MNDRGIIVIRRDPATGIRDSAWLVPVGGGASTKVMSGIELDEPQVSPDGRSVAYVSRESGQEEVYVEPFRRAGNRVRVSTQGGGQPKWRTDGRELFFTTVANRLASVTVKVDADRFDVSLPTDLFTLRSVQGPDYDDHAPQRTGSGSSSPGVARSSRARVDRAHVSGLDGPLHGPAHAHWRGRRWRWRRTRQAAKGAAGPIGGNIAIRVGRAGNRPAW
jgi:hypothetical protein